MGFSDESRAKFYSYIEKIEDPDLKARTIEGFAGASAEAELDVNGGVEVLSRSLEARALYMEQVEETKETINATLERRRKMAEITATVISGFKRETPFPKPPKRQNRLSRFLSKFPFTPF